jgi:hypothetical protein
MQKQFTKQVNAMQASAARRSKNVHTARLLNDDLLALCVKHALKVCKRNSITRNNSSSEDAMHSAVQQQHSALHNFLTAQTSNFYSLYVTLCLALQKK